MWVDDPHAGEARLVFEGHLRIVRSAKRARTLRKRGVEMDCYGSVLNRYWVWFETNESYDARAAVRRMTRVLADIAAKGYSLQIEQRTVREGPKMVLYYFDPTEVVPLDRDLYQCAFESVHSNPDDDIEVDLE